MSVQTEISRLESAKQAIASAIADKGVTVPSGTMLDGMAALIAIIEAGGGGSSDTGGASLSILGTGTCSGSGTANFTITHGLGVTPKACFVYHPSGTISTYTVMGSAVAYHGDDTGSILTLQFGTRTTSLTINLYNTMSVSCDSETMSTTSGTYNIYFKSSISYRWIAFG